MNVEAVNTDWCNSLSDLQVEISFHAKSKRMKKGLLRMQTEHGVLLATGDAVFSA